MPPPTLPLPDDELQAIERRWEGFYGRLRAYQDGDGDWWVQDEEDTSETGVAMLTCDCAEELAAVWAGAGPDVRALLAEVKHQRAANLALRRQLAGAAPAPAP